MKKFLIYILVVCAFVSCKSKENRIFLDIKTTNVNFSSVSGVEMIPVSTNGEYTATSSYKWCTATLAGDFLKVKVNENVDSQERIAIVTLSAEGVASIRVNVKQAGTDPFFTIDPALQTQQFNSDSEFRLLKIDANVPFTVVSSQTWCQMEMPSEAIPNLRITVAENKDITSRDAEIVISADGFEDLIISVNQNGLISNKQGMTIKGLVSCDNAGVPNVVVSDGYEVTVTDAHGVYYLPSKKHNQYVFISVPGNYEVPCIGRAPQFFKRLTKEVNVVERCDFELTAVCNNKHVVLTMADLHLANRADDIAQFEKMLVDINEVIDGYQSSGNKVYVLTLGDLTWDGYWYKNNFTLANYVPYMNRINAPVFNTIGNHDNNPYVVGDWGSQQFFRDVLGPNYYSFNLGRVHYLVLDDIVYNNTGGAQGIVGKRDYINNITSEQIEWIKKDLEKVNDKSAPLIIALHIPVFTAPDVNNCAKCRLINSDVFLNCLSDFSDVHIISGHTHNNSNYVYSNAIMEHTTAAVCATWWCTGSNGMAGNHICRDGSVGGYGVWEIDNKAVQWYYKSTGYDRSYQFRTYDLNSIEMTAVKYAPYANATYAAKVVNFADVYAIAGTANEVLINVWGYDPDWTITVKEGESILPVTRVLAKDPLHIISYAMAKLNLNTNPSSGFLTSNTTHMFKVTTSSPVSTLILQVTDRFGHNYSETMTRPKYLTTNMR